MPSLGAAGRPETSSLGRAHRDPNVPIPKDVSARLTEKSYANGAWLRRSLRTPGSAVAARGVRTATEELTCARIVGNCLLWYRSPHWP